MLLYDDDILAKTETRREITRRAVVDVNRKGMMARESSKQDQRRAGYIMVVVRWCGLAMNETRMVGRTLNEARPCVVSEVHEVTKSFRQLEASLRNNVKRRTRITPPPFYITFPTP